MSKHPADLPDAARRHQHCADMLHDAEPAEAGYLYGLAAECAVKQVATMVPCLRRDDILYAHFPDLRRLVLDHAAGREAQRLLRLISDPSGYLGGWHVSMRYANRRAVNVDLTEAWRRHATSALSLMEST